MKKLIYRSFFQLIYLVFCFFNKKKYLTCIYSSNSSKYENMDVLLNYLGEKSIIPFCKIDSDLTIKNIWTLSKTKIVLIDQATALTSNLNLRATNTEVVQIWHAGGAYKKIGFDASDGSEYDRKRIERIHGNTSWVIVSDPKLRNIYANAFHISKDRVLPLGIARTDCYIPRLGTSQNKVLLWAPTFRLEKGKRVGRFRIGDLLKIVNALGTDWTLAVRVHPSIEVDFCGEQFLDWSQRPLAQCLSQTSILITDYSSIFFDFSLYHGRVFWLVLDVDEYKIERGFYFNPLEKYPDYAADSVELMIEKINKSKMSNCSLIKKEFMSSCDGGATKRIVDFLCKLCEDLK